MRDSVQALDLDLAIAARARGVRDAAVEEMLQAESGGIYGALLVILSE